MASKQKPAALQPHSQAKTKPAAAAPDRRLPVLVIASIAVVIIGILLLKDRQPPAVALAVPPTGGPATQAATPAQGAPAAMSGAAAVAGPFRPSSPADQLNQALTGGHPVLVFMHSNNCQSCIDMMKVVEQVYPEFAGQIALVDVNVYDEANGPLMQKLGLRYIPTVVVFDKAGKTAQNVGAMKAEAFRTFLRQKALGG